MAAARELLRKGIRLTDETEPWIEQATRSRTTAAYNATALPLVASLDSTSSLYATPTRYSLAHTHSPHTTGVPHLHAAVYSIQGGEARREKLLELHLQCTVYDKSLQ